MSQQGEDVWEVLNRRDPQFTHTQINNRGARVYTMIDCAVWRGDGDGVSAFSVIGDGMHDHRMLRVVLNSAGKAKPFTPVVRWTKLRRGTLEERQEYARVFGDAVQKLSRDYGRTPTIEQFTDMVTAAGIESLGMTKPPRARMSYSSQPWWTFELTNLSKRYKRARRRLWRLWRRLLRRPDVVAAGEVESRREELRLARALWRRELRIAKDRYWQAQRARLSRASPDAVREAFSMFRLMSGARGGGSRIGHSQVVVEDEWEGILGTPPPDTCKDNEYKREVDEWRVRHAGDPLPVDKYITVGELESVVYKLANHKAGGPDTFTNEVLKALPSTVVAMLARAMNTALEAPADALPSVWFKSLVALLPKVEDPSPTQFRPITLLSCVAKCLETVIWRRLVSDGVSSTLMFDQGGFQIGRGCAEQVWRVEVLNQVMRQRRMQGLILFFDIKKAYDSVPHEVLMHRLITEFPQVPVYVVRFVDVWIRGHRRELLAGGGQGERRGLEVARGVPQGSVLACFLFNVFFNSLLQRLRARVDGVRIQMASGDPRPPRQPAHPAVGGGGSLVVGGRRLRNTAARRAARARRAPVQPQVADTYEWRMVSPAFADDLCVTCSTTEDAQRACEVVEEWQRESGVWFAASKCAVMRIGYKPKRARDRISTQVELNGEEVQLVKDFKYLGVTIKGADRQHVRRTALANEKAVDKVKGWTTRERLMLMSRYGCPVHTGALLAKQTYVPKMLYGTEVFPLCAGTEYSRCPTRRACGKMARTALNTYDSVSTTAALAYLGWEDPRSASYRRLLKFVLKMAWSRFEELGKLLRSVAVQAGNLSYPDDRPRGGAGGRGDGGGGGGGNADDDDDDDDDSQPGDDDDDDNKEEEEEEVGGDVIEWWTYVREAVRFASDSGWIDSTQDFYESLRSADAVDAMRTSLETVRPPDPHPVVASGSKYAHFSFPFFTGTLNPPNRRQRVGEGEPPCLVCHEAEGDTASHLVHECQDPTVLEVIRDVTTQLGYSEADTRAVLAGDMAMPDMKKEQWRAVAAGHRRLWKLRIKRRKEAHGNGGAGGSDGDDASDNDNDDNE